MKIITFVCMAVLLCTPCFAVDCCNDAACVGCYKMLDGTEGVVEQTVIYGAILQGAVIN